MTDVAATTATHPVTNGGPVPPEPQQRAQRAAAPATSAQRRPAPAPARTTQDKQVRAAPDKQLRAAQGKQARGTANQRVGARPAGSGTSDFERLMQRNTVDARTLAQRARRRKNPMAGKIALGLAIVSAAVDASAFAVFMGGDTTFAFGICFVVVFLTLIAAVLGFVAAVGSFGRWYGAIGVVLAFFANPVILIVLLVVVAPEALTTM
ncbi:hypothetical protein [Curtobacterium citreum]|uniref:hypothetical protein n=1 Tax=Curtobacterium citreum TaxID=2036 RepID=UPI00128FBDCD|nr:hypothetical protein [Curtobacterium citreum]